MDVLSWCLLWDLLYVLSEDDKYKVVTYFSNKVQLKLYKMPTIGSITT
jgi:hypothetical protein